MAASLRCPKCRTPIPGDLINSSGAVTCPGCGKSLRAKAARRDAAGQRARSSGQIVPPEVSRGSRNLTLLIVIAGLVGGGVLLMLAVGVGLWLFMGKNVPERARTAPLVVTPDDNRVAVIDAPLALPAPPEVQIESPSDPGTNRNPELENPLRSEEPLWDIELQPAPEIEPVAADLNICVNLFDLASLNGPFALVANEGRSEDSTVPIPGRHYTMSKRSVFDLRTGKEERSFNVVHVAVTRRLGPDGQCVVAPAFEKVTVPISDRLAVWKSEQADPSLELTAAGDVVWFDFVGPTQLAVVSTEGSAVDSAVPGSDATTTGVLQLFDIVTGEAASTIPVSLTVELPESVRSPRPFGSPQPSVSLCAVSPSGQLIALGVQDGLTIVSLPDGRELGGLPVPGGAINNPAFQSLDFSPDGSRLFAVVFQSLPGRGSEPYLMEWDMATGRLLADRRLEHGPTGRMLPGPDADAVIVGNAVIGLSSATRLQTLPFAALRWSGDALLAYEETDLSKHLVSRPFDREAYLAAVHRPAVLPVDRSQITLQTPTPPAEWSPPPSVTPRAPSRRTAMPSWPTVFGDDSGVELRFHAFRQGTLPLPPSLIALRADLQTGQYSTEPVVLWETTRPPDDQFKSRNHRSEQALPVAALSADGTRLAVCDPTDSRRVDVWAEDGTRIQGLRPYEDASIDWLGWSESRLLVLAGGKLSAWNIETGVALFEVAGEYTTPVAFAPSSSWLAIARSDGCDLVDAETGGCLARCLRPQNSHPYRDLAVSPDGRRLAGVRDEHGPSRDGKFSTESAIDLWDLTTGQSIAVPVRLKPELGWRSTRQLLASASYSLELIDVVIGDVVWTSWSEGGPSNPPEVTPDGKVWMYDGVWRAQQKPPATSRITGVLDQLDDLALFVDKIRVEANLGELKRSQSAARRMAEHLQQRSFLLGPGGWVCRGTYQIVAGTEQISFKAPPGRPQIPDLTVPVLEIRWELVDPNGTTVWQQPDHVEWEAAKSQYAVREQDASGSTASLQFGPGVILDFKGHDPRIAIIEELKPMAVQFEIPQNVPRRLVRIGNEFEPLPIFDPLSFEETQVVAP